MIYFRRAYPALLTAAVSLGLLACTETQTKNTPTPTPTPPPTATVVNEAPKDYGQYTELVWADEFTTGPLDQTKWSYELGGGGWGNQELQAYTNSPDNVFINGNGNLVIQARQQQSGSNGYTSGRLVTKGKQSFRFGRIDVRAKVPKGKGIWPAIWLLGADIDQNNWPKCGEIDIMELRGSQPNTLIATMHYANSTGNRELQSREERLAFDLSDDFHTYSVVRSKDMTRFYLDGSATPYYTYTSTAGNPYPFNNPFFMILNVAVGGQFDGDPTASTVFPQQMQVDYVRYYQYK